MEINEQLDQVKSIIEKELVTGDHYLNGSLNYVKETTGKMLRPRFLLIGASFGKRLTKKQEANLIRLAAAIESLHVATLIHDDVIDESKLRRGRESVQSKYSKEYAIYMGDFILSRCFVMLSQLDIEQNLLIDMAKAMNQICIGEMKQHKHRFNVQVNPINYLRIVARKTATLFSISLSAGAYQAKASNETVKLLARIGHEIGMVFQLVDDLLDYEGLIDDVGKDLEKDMIKGYYNIPVLFAMQSDDDIEREELKNLLMDSEHIYEHKEEIIERIKKLGGVDKTKELASRYNSRALKLIDKLPESEGKQALLHLASNLIHRDK
jgi:heptaprenyl diphosphate synthase